MAGVEVAAATSPAQFRRDQAARIDTADEALAEMPRLSETIKFIFENTRRGIPGSVARLYYLHTTDKTPTTYKEVSSIIGQDDETHDYFLDTNFITRHEVDGCVWDALSSKRITFTGGVWEELQPWRSNAILQRQPCLAL